MNERGERPVEGRYVGLISGTSMDGIDAVLVTLGERRLQTEAALTRPYSSALKRRLHAVILPDARLSLHELASLDIEVGAEFATAARDVLDAAGCTATDLVAIGSHGQTLRHAPHAELPYSLQIGSAATIAARVGALTVADFRAMDIAYGGEGAPLVPAFHEWAMRSADENRAIANIGGIANISLLPAAAATPLSGYDTGPGNCLMDVWCARERGVPFDADGAWGATGTCVPALLEAMLNDAYYSAPPPKSTGREIFNLAWLTSILKQPAFARLAAADVQATLAELTVETLAREIERHGPDWAARLYVCGGGVHNRYLMARLATRLAPLPVRSTVELGIDSDMVEASAFAWLAYMRLAGRPVRMTTGAGARAITLGAIYSPTAGFIA